MWKVVLPWMIAVLVFCCASAAELTGKVVAVTDGDTVKVLDDMDNAIFRVRLAGVDAPEKGQAGGGEAMDFLSRSVLGKAVIVRFGSIDRYGRIIGRVMCSGTDIGLLLLRAGMCWHYGKYSDCKEYAKAQQEAQQCKRGIWHSGKAIPPQEWRRLRKKKPGEIPGK